MIVLLLIVFGFDGLVVVLYNYWILFVDFCFNVILLLDCGY